MSDFDLVVIGGGPGGYVAAIRAAQLGMSVACVEMRGALGGTCLNVGCIPSKALLDSSEKYEDVKKHFGDHGIKAQVGLDLKTMLARKEKVVIDLTKGIEGLFKKNKVIYVKGRGQIKSSSEVVVDGKQSLKTKRILIATGSDIVRLPGIEIDEKRIVSSTGALSLERVPEHLVVIGGGVIGLELGSVWRRLGAKVTVIEYLDKIGGPMDAEVAKQFQRVLEKQEMNFKLGMKVTGVESKSAASLVVSMEPSAGGKKEVLGCDVVLVSIGRKPYTEKLGLENVGIKLDERGRIPINDHFETASKGVYAIGDVVRGAMLAHKAEDEGVVAAEIMAGQSGHIYYDAIPNVIYTSPEVASVGKTEEEVKAAGIQYKIGKFPFLANSRSRATGLTDGFVKILADAATDRVLGIHIIGPQAGTLIAEAALAMEYGASSEDIARTCHAHPTYNEAMKEAALAVLGRAIHI
jgi:dihydrolipoamide dehydrogenase